MDRKYNPNDFEYPLNEYMEEAYKAVSLKNKALVNVAAAKIHMSVKLAVKDGTMSANKGGEIKDYFWELYADI